MSAFDDMLGTLRGSGGAVNEEGVQEDPAERFRNDFQDTVEQILTKRADALVRNMSHAKYASFFDRLTKVMEDEGFSPREGMAVLSYAMAGLSHTMYKSIFDSMPPLPVALREVLVENNIDPGSVMAEAHASLIMYFSDRLQETIARRPFGEIAAEPGTPPSSPFEGNPHVRVFQVDVDNPQSLAEQLRAQGLEALPGFVEMFANFIQQNRPDEPVDDEPKGN